MNERVKQTERELANIKKEANNYQNMLQQSQAQYLVLEKKYSRVKKILRDYQHRERDMVSGVRTPARRNTVLTVPFCVCRSSSRSITCSTCRRRTPSTMRW